MAGALFLLDPLPISQGWGVDDAGVLALSSGAIRLALFDGTFDAVTAVVNDPMVNSLTLQTYVPVNMRVPRGATLGFQTESAGVATFIGQFLLGLFPAGLGQDVVS